MAPLVYRHHTSWATAASNIQDAVDQAVDLSTIWIGPGRYTASATPPVYRGTNVVYVTYLGYRKLHFRGSTGDPADVVIDGEGKYRGLAYYYPNASTKVVCRLQDLTFSNCLSAADNGRGVLFDSGTPDTRVWTGVVDNCVFVDNTAAYGGGISIGYKGRARVLIASNCVFRGNQAATGGGIYTGPGGAHRLIGCTVEENTASSSGGAIYGGDGYGAGERRA